MSQPQTCPRRMSDFGPWERAENLDTWGGRGGIIGQEQIGPGCSFCGSLHPDRFMELVREGWIVGPTDKNYKAYLGGPGGGSHEAKFYYQHLSDEQRQEFIDLVNAGQMKIGYPGYLYVLPFFCTRAERDHDAAG